MAPEELKSYVGELHNGLRVIVAPQPHLHLAHVALHVRVGSRFETKRTSGVSHFLEHMLHRGTQRVQGAHALSSAFMALGTELDAKTGVEDTSFALTLAPANLEPALQILADVFRNPSFVDIDTERRIVLAEQASEPDDLITESMIYDEHPFAYPVAGTARSVEALTVAVLRAHHARFYTASSSVLVFSGAVDREQAMDIARREFECLPRGERIAARTAPPAQRRRAYFRLRLSDDDDGLTDLRVCLRAIARRSPESARCDVFMGLLDGGMASRIYRRLVNDVGLGYHASASYEGYEDDGFVEIRATVPPKQAVRAVNRVFTILRELATDGPSEDELAMVRQRMRAQATARLDSVVDAAAFFAAAALLGNDGSVAAHLAERERVTATDVRDFARVLVQPSRLSVFASGLRLPRRRERLKASVMAWHGAP